MEWKRKKPTGEVGFLRSETIELLDRPDVFSARPLRAVSRVVRDTLSLTQTIEIRSFNIRHVEKHVLVASGFDEPEALVRQPFDSSLSHTISFLKKAALRCCPTLSGRAAPPRVSFIAESQKYVKAFLKFIMAGVCPKFLADVRSFGPKSCPIAVPWIAVLQVCPALQIHECCDTLGNVHAGLF